VGSIKEVWMSYTIGGIVVTPLGADGETEGVTGTGGSTTYEWSCGGKTYQARMENIGAGSGSTVIVVEDRTTERGRFDSLEEAVKQLCK